ncbi:hypothetical protein EW145_g7845, partial [Phellinidium pouzarii]
MSARRLVSLGLTAPSGVSIRGPPLLTYGLSLRQLRANGSVTCPTKCPSVCRTWAEDHGRRRFHASVSQLSSEQPSRSASASPRPQSGILAGFLPAFLRPEQSSGSSTGSSFRKIVTLAKPERKPLLIAVGLLLVSSSVSLSIPFAIGKLIDFFASTSPQIPFGLSLMQASTLLLTAFTVGAAANAGRSILMRLSGQRIVAGLRQRSYASSLRQEVEFVERGEGDVIRAMFYLSPTLTALMLTVVPPVSLGAVFYGRYLKRLSNRTQEAVGEMTKVASESLSAFRTVQAFNAQPQEEGKFAARVNDVLSLARKEALASGFFFGATGWSGNVTLLCLLGYGGSLVSKGVLSVGDLTSMLLYTVYVGNGLSMLTSFFASIMRGIGAGARIFELLERQPAIPQSGAPVTPTRRGPVSFDHVSFEYPSRKGVEVLKNFNLKLDVGESVAIVGQSGSGKSSVQSLLLRFYDPISGSITFDGQ